MKNWRVKLTIRKMGMQCQSCKQTFECQVVAENEVEAAQFAKELSKADPEIHQFQINLIKEIIL